MLEELQILVRKSIQDYNQLVFKKNSAIIAEEYRENDIYVYILKYKNKYFKLFFPYTSYEGMELDGYYVSYMQEVYPKEVTTIQYVPV